MYDLLNKPKSKKPIIQKMLSASYYRSNEYKYMRSNPNDEFQIPLVEEQHHIIPLSIIKRLAGNDDVNSANNLIQLPKCPPMPPP